MKNAIIIGSGTMGAGIAEVCAKSGMTTTLADVSQELLDKAKGRIEASLSKAVEKGKLDEANKSAAIGRLSYATSYDAAAADLIIEAVPENIELKKKLLGDVSRKNPGALLATNTSSLSVTEIAAACEDPSRVVGLHFFNPVPVMSLVEIVLAEQSTEASELAALVLVEALGKVPVIVNDAPGFATSRLGIILGMEAIRMVESGVAAPKDIDTAMELGYRHPMGPLKLTDLVGLDVRLAIAEHLTREIGPQFAPPPLLRRLVRAGKLGKKTGEGFYRWNGNEAIPK